jgi:P-type Cu+ transporter
MKEKDRGKMTKAVFAVRGVDCVTCALAIEKQLRRVEGVKDVKSAIMLNEVFVYYDDAETNQEEIAEGIRKSGYAGHMVRKEQA